MKQLKVAQADLLHAAAFEPMYGALHVIRSIYGELGPGEIDAGWLELTKDLVDVGYDVWKGCGKLCPILIGFERLPFVTNVSQPFLCLYIENISISPPGTVSLLV